MAWHRDLHEAEIRHLAKADSQGKYTITAFELKQVDYSRPIQKPVETPINYATIDDLTKLQVRLENMINELKSKEIKQDE